MCTSSGTELTRQLGSPEPAAPAAPADADHLSSRFDELRGAYPSAATAGANAAAETTAALIASAATIPSLRTVFRVKYVAEGVAYLEGGRAQGLAEGMKLEVKDYESTRPAGRQRQRRRSAGCGRAGGEWSRGNFVGHRHSRSQASRESRRPGLPFERRRRSPGAAARVERDAAIPGGDFLQRRRHAG